MVSIIIPTLNEEKYLPNLLQCIRNQTFKDYEIIVADAGSTDKTCEIAKNFGAKVVKGGLPGIGRNKGALHSNSNTLIFIDSDITFDENFLEKTINEFQKRKLDAASVRYDMRKIKKLKYHYAFRSWDFTQLFSQYTFIPQASSQLLIYKKEVFKSLDGFDEELILSEDIDIIKRTVRNGFKYRVVFSAKMYPATRRYDKYGILIPIIIGSIGAFLVYINLARNRNIQNKLEKLYGGLRGWASN